MYHLIFKKWKDYDFLTSALAGMGLLLAVINYEFEVYMHPEALNTKIYPYAT